MMKTYLGCCVLGGLSLTALLASGPVVADAAPTKGPLELAKENAALTEKYGRSIVTVRYYAKKDAEGREPRFEVPYKCPNCSQTHWRDGGSSSEKGIPAEFVGFLVASDRVLMKDLLLDPTFVDRIEVVCGDETRAAVEFEAVPERKALVLKTETPFEQAKPLTFTGVQPKEPKYFYLVREDGLTVSGIAGSKMAAFKHYAEAGLSLYEGNSNTLVLDEQGEAVTVALDEKVVLGEETFTSPTEWKTEPAAKRDERRTALLARVGRGVLPVYLQFEANSKDEGRGSRFRWSSDDNVKNDLDTVGVVLAGGKVLVLAKLAAADTARLVKLEATLPDGKKASLVFEGSYAEEGALAATFADGLPEGVEPFELDGTPAVRLFNRAFNTCYMSNRGGQLKVTPGTVCAQAMKRVRGNQTIAEFEWRSGLRRDYSSEDPCVVLSDDGKLLSVEIKDRHDDRSSDERNVQGARLAALVTSPAYDPENVPRSAEDRKRTPWLGVEVQMAGADLVREKKALSFFRSYAAERAALVTEVAPDSPAATLGIKAGDILISAKYPDSSQEEDLFADRDYYSGLNWDEVFGDDRFIEIGSSGEMMPWPNVEGGVNERLAKFGVGTQVEIAWVSDGVRKTGTVKLALAPVHFRNAPRVRNKELGLTVCDMTDEVRKFFKFDEKAPGVVVAKVKGGGIAAVAGIRPLELITEVNGEGVTSAKDFAAKTKGKKELNFNVRRLTATRIVPVTIQ